MYWIELPLILLLAIVIHYNSESTNWVKLYPLIILCAAAIIFVFIFLFRIIEISYSDIRYIGRFTSRDSATVKAGRTIALRPEKHGKVRIYLHGIDKRPLLDWAIGSNDEPMEICMFRGKAWGGKKTLRRILTYFGVTAEELNEILSSVSYEKDFENVTVKTVINETEQKEILIRINKTL